MQNIPFSLGVCFFDLPEAVAFPLAELWAHLTPPPPCTHPSDEGCGTAGHPHQGRPTDPFWPSDLCWLSPGNRAQSMSVPEGAPGARSRSDVVGPTLLVCHRVFRQWLQAGKLSWTMFQACNCSSLTFGHMVVLCYGFSGESIQELFLQYNIMTIRTCKKINKRKLYF